MPELWWDAINHNPYQVFIIEFGSRKNAINQHLVREGERERKKKSYNFPIEAHNNHYPYTKIVICTFHMEYIIRLVN